MFLPAFVCLSVCLSICEQDYSKTPAWIWMKCCVSTDVGTWTNWLTFEPDLDSPDARTGLLSPILYALQRGILLRRENPTYWYWFTYRSLQRRVVLFTVSRGNNFVGGTCATLGNVILPVVVVELSNARVGAGGVSVRNTLVLTQNYRRSRSFHRIIPYT